MITAEKVKSLLSEIKQVERQLAVERDKICTLLETLEQLGADAEEAQDALENAADALSRLL